MSFTEEEVEKLTDRIQNAGTEVVNAKAGSVCIHLVINRGLLKSVYASANFQGSVQTLDSTKDKLLLGE